MTSIPAVTVTLPDVLVSWLEGIHLISLINTILFNTLFFFILFSQVPSHCFVPTRDTCQRLSADQPRFRGTGGKSGHHSLHVYKKNTDLGRLAKDSGGGKNKWVVRLSAVVSYSSLLRLLSSLLLIWVSGKWRSLVVGLLNPATPWTLENGGC